MSSTRTDALLLDLQFTPMNYRVEKLAEFAAELESELNQANDAYIALREIFKLKDIQQ